MKKFIYTIIAVVAVFAMPSVMMADEQQTIDVQYLVLQQDDGTQSKFALREYPELTFEDGSLVVTTTERTITVSMSDIIGYSFVTEKEPVITAIASVGQSEPATPVFSYSRAQFSGLKSGATVMVYNINGKALTTFTADAEGIARIDLASLPKGIIILRSSGKNIKIMNKY